MDVTIHALTHSPSEHTSHVNRARMSVGPLLSVVSQVTGRQFLTYTHTGHTQKQTGEPRGAVAGAGAPMV